MCCFRYSLSAQPNVFKAQHISEVQAFTKPEKWYWVSGGENIADLGTRPNATVQDVYLEEPEWLKLEEGL